MAVWAIDVWHSVGYPVTPDGDDWRRYIIDALDPIAAELKACQMAASHGGWVPVRSVIIDWEQDGWE